MRVSYVPRGTGFEVSLVDDGPVLASWDCRSGSAPTLSGDERYTANLALVGTLLGYGENERKRRYAKAPEKKQSHADAAKRHLKETIHIAELVARLGPEMRRAWCSGCFQHAEHRRVTGAIPRYICSECGTPTIWCAVPTCHHAAILTPSNAVAFAYCASHRHEIPGFEKLAKRMSTLGEAGDWLEFDHLNAKRFTTVTAGVLGAALVVAPAAFFAAPAVGAAVGSIASGGALSGAAATSSGLAMLGGGSIAAGGAGMAGGVMVVTATGTALGGVLGAATTTAYVGSDKSFRIEKLRDGSGVPVLVASGFLTDGQDGWGGWYDIVHRRYPDSPVYRVHWGAKELASWGLLAGGGAAKVAAHGAFVKLAKKGTKALAGVPGLSAILAAQHLATNPWHVARTRAEMTGAALADLIARTDEGPYVLVGHSLGARVMVHAALALGTRTGQTPRIAEMHLLGAAVGTKGDWRRLQDAVAGTVYNYRSENDAVLKVVYATAEFGAKAVGYYGFNSKWPRIKDRNVTKRVAGHTHYVDNVRLV